MPSLLPPHPAFVHAYLGQGFPPTSAAAAAAVSPLGLYQPQLSPTAHAQLLEGFMRQKALQSMTGAMSPFVMTSMPGAYPHQPPPTKDSPQN